LIIKKRETKKLALVAEDKRSENEKGKNPRVCNGGGGGMNSGKEEQKTVEDTPEESYTRKPERRKGGVRLGK